MTEQTTQGVWYTVTSPNGCTVTDQDGNTLLTVAPSTQGSFKATGNSVTLSDESAIVQANFNGAPIAQASSGGSSSGGGELTADQQALLYGAAQRAGSNTFTGANTFNGAVTYGETSTVDLSQAAVTPPAGWNVEEELTAEQAERIADAAQLSGSNTFTGSVDLSAASVTPPAGWQVTGTTYSTGTPAALADAAIFDLGELSADADLSALAFPANATKVQTCELWLSLGATAYSVTWPAGLVWLDGEPALEAGKSYRFALRCEPNGKTIANLAYDYPA